MLKSMSNRFLILLLLPLCLYTQEKNDIGHLFAHGLNRDKHSAQFYVLLNILQQDTTHSFNFADARRNKNTNKPSDIGQTNDIDALAKKYNAIEKNYTGIILIGSSRGAATILNFAGKEQPKKIAAIIAESPFAHVKDAAKNIATINKNLELLPECFHLFIIKMMYPAFKKKGEHPIDLVSKIDKNIPILLICSKEDWVVPYESTVKLYQELKESGHQKTHIIILEKGIHGSLNLQRTAYQAGLHAFYKKYNLPYDADLAQEGETYLQ